MLAGTAEGRIAAALPDLYALTPIDDFPARVLPLVKRLVGGDKADYTEVNLATGDFRVLVDPEPPQLRHLEEARIAFTHQHPVMAHFLHDDNPSARLISDFVGAKEFRRLGLYGEFFRPLGVEDQLTVTLCPRLKRRLAGISVDRGLVGFDDNDREVMDRLRPHLARARENALRFSQALDAGTTDELADPTALDRLTGRQRDILGQLSRGHTNSQIARTLDISAGTVRKHVEHVLQRLGVSSRTAAAVYYTSAMQARPSTDWTAGFNFND